MPHRFSGHASGGPPPAARQHDRTNRDHVHAADSFPDHGPKTHSRRYQRALFRCCQSVCDIWDSWDTGCWDTPPVEPRRGSYVARAPPPRVHLGREPINLEWSADVRFGAHNGLKSDIAPCPKSAINRHAQCCPVADLAALWMRRPEGTMFRIYRF